MSSPEPEPLPPTPKLVGSDDFGGAVSTATGKKSKSTWFALRNPVFCRLWLASLLSGTFVSAQDVTATWLMHYLGASSFWLSLMATAASAPFFLFTLPAGVVADIVNRRAIMVGAVLWQAACSGLLALGAWTDDLSPVTMLACIFALGIGLAFGAPVWGAIVPDIVSKEELPSAITLGGVQLNLSGIAGFDDLHHFGWHSLGAGGIRTLGRWTACHARMGARTDECVPDNVRQGSMAIGASLWAIGVARAGLDLTFFGSAVLALLVLALGHRFSINFAVEAVVEAAPLENPPDLPIVPENDDGPITITIDYFIANEDREEFRTLMQEVQATFRRNGAFQCRLDESLDRPGLFRLEYLVSTWAEYLRQNMRMTVDETKFLKKVSNLCANSSRPIVRHFLSTQRYIHLPSFGFSGRTFLHTSRMPRARETAMAHSSSG